MTALLHRLRVGFFPPAPRHCTAGDYLVNAAWERRMQRKRILIVDDDDLMLELLTLRVQPKFHVHFETAVTVQAAREIMAREHFDVVVLDYKLTNGTGIDLYRDIVRADEPPQVVFLTNYESGYIAREVEKIGPARVYTKDRMLNLDFMTALFDDMGIEREDLEG